MRGHFGRILCSSKYIGILIHGASKPNMSPTLTFSTDMIIFDKDKTFHDFIEIKQRVIIGT